MNPVRLERSMSMVKRHFHYRKPICPFISSTFQDFQAERDILMKKVFPAIDTLCRERGTYCAPCDLRWGINDTQANSGLVIQLCLDYVLKSMPFFICLLGERYGSHRPPDAPPLPASYEDLDPNADWLDKNLLVAASAGYDWVTQETYQHCSVTELEIIQAAFLEECEYCYFYCRKPDHVDYLYTDLPENERQEKLQVFESESDYSALKVRDLKARIVKKGLRVKYFKNPEELARIVLDDWLAVVNLLYPPLEDMVSDTNTERFVEWMAHETFAETRRRAFVQSNATENLFAEITQFAVTALDEPPVECKNQVQKCGNYLNLVGGKIDPVKILYKSILTVVSDRGCGKTSVVANWVKTFSQEHSDITVFSHYIGSSALSVDVAGLMRRAAVTLRGGFQDTSEGSDITDMTEDTADFYHLSETFVAALSLGPCVLVIDGIDELTGSYGLTPQQVKEMSWLPLPLPPQCKIILTTSKSDSTYKVLSQRGDTVTYTVPFITDESRKKDIVREHLAMHCKSLSENQLTRIVSNKLSDTPIFLSILANELRLFGVYSRLDYHLDSYLEATSIRDLWSRIIQRWIKDYSWTKEEKSTDGSEEDEVGYEGWLADALRLIAVSRNGLCQSEILDLLYQIGYHGEARVTAFDWALFRSAAMDALFERPGGLLCFFHQHFREAVEYNLLGKVSPFSASPTENSSPFPASQEFPRNHTPTDFHHQLACYFQLQPNSLRRTDELPWQLKMAGDFPGLVRVLSEPKVFMNLHGDLQIHSRKLDLLAYWKILTQDGYIASDTYLQMLNPVCGHPAVEEVKNPEELVNLLEVISVEDGEEKLVLISPCSTARAVPTIMTTPASISSEECDMGSPGDLDESSSSSNETPTLSETEQAKLCRSVGQFLSESGQFEHAEKVLLQADEKLEKNYPLDSAQQELLCEIEESLANLYLYQLKKEMAKKWYNRALSTLDSLMEGMLEAADVKKYMEVKGRLLDRLGDMLTHEHILRKAEAIFMEAKKCMISAGSVTGKAMLQHHIGILRMSQKKFVEAELCFRQSISIRERWFGKSHPLVAHVLNDLAGLLCHQNNKNSYSCQEAETLYRRALRIRENCLGTCHLLVATTLFHLGRLLRTYRQRQALTEALALLRRSLDIRTKILGADHHITKAVERVLHMAEASNRPRTTSSRNSSKERSSSRSQSWNHRSCPTSPSCEQRHYNSRSSPGRNSRDGSYSSRSWTDHNKRKGYLRKQGRSHSDIAHPEKITKERRSYSCQSWHERDHENSDHNTGRDCGNAHRKKFTRSRTVGNFSSMDYGDWLYGSGSKEIIRENDCVTPDSLTPDGSRCTSPGSVFEAQEQLLSRNPLQATHILADLPETQTDSQGNRSLSPAQTLGTGGKDNQCGVKNVSSSLEKKEETSEPRNSNVKEIRTDVDGSKANAAYPEPLPQRIPRNSSRNRQRHHPPCDTYLDTFASVEQQTPDPTVADRLPADGDNVLSHIPESTSHSSTNELGAGCGPVGYHPEPAVSVLQSGPPYTSPVQPMPPFPQVSHDIHLQHCYIPGPHSTDVQNAFSPVVGPHNSVESLVGPPPCPRNLSLGMQHTSAWYHVPGRYPVGHDPYPAKRNQVRPSNAVYNSYHDPRSVGQCWPQIPGWPVPSVPMPDAQTYQTNPPSIVYYMYPAPQHPFPH